jgi:type IV secretion system protein VirB6/type IV secretion system protein TrbL
MSSLHWKRIASLLLATLGIFLSLNANAADGTNVLNNIADRYQAQASLWEGVILTAATRLFWSLALISMVWTFGTMALRKADIQELFAELVRYLMFTGFFFFLLTNAPAIAKSIMNSLVQLASAASGMPAMTPSGIMDIGFNIFKTVVDRSSFWKPVDSAVGLLVGIVILVVLALVAINMLILLASGWILAYAGIFFLGFGGSRWTSDMAINYYKTVLGVGASLMGMTLIVGIGQAFLNDYYATLGEAGFNDLAVILVVALVLLHLVNKIPSLISGLITGASVGGASSMGAAGAGTALAAGAMAGAAAASAVAAMVGGATSAAGWSSAVKAAMQSGGSDGGSTAIQGMPSMAGASGGGGNSGGSDSGVSTSGTSTPLGAAMGDSGSTGVASFRAPSEADASDSAEQERSGGQNLQGEKTGESGRARESSTPPKAQTPGGSGLPSGQSATASSEKPARSGLAAFGSAVAEVARAKMGSTVDAANHRIAQTTGGRVAAEIHSPGTAAAERQNKADINKTQTVAGKAKAARAFMAGGSVSGASKAEFAGDGFSAFNDPNKSIDDDAEISAFANRKTS